MENILPQIGVERIYVYNIPTRQNHFTQDKLFKDAPARRNNFAQTTIAAVKGILLRYQKPNRRENQTLNLLFVLTKCSDEKSKNFISQVLVFASFSMQVELETVIDPNEFENHGNSR